MPYQSKSDRKASVYRWREANPEKVREIDKRSRDKRKNIVFDYYGRICVCCGETEPDFLTIDHINNDGAEHRRSLGVRASGDQLYRDIIRKEFPDDLQVLCWNCNCGRQRNNGICPHHKEVMLYGAAA